MDDPVQPLPATEEESICSYCNAKFKSKSRMNSHIKARHVGVKYFCDYCDFQTSYEKSLPKHVKSVHEMTKVKETKHKVLRKKGECKECPVCSKYVYSLKEHMLVHKEGSKICKYCDSKFKQGGSLKRHVVQIHKIVEGNIGNYGKKYKGEIVKCEICEKQMIKGSLKLHIREMHDGNRKVWERVECKECKKSLRIDSMKRHMNDVHGDKPKPCRICKENIKVEDMDEHKKVHQVHKCEVCSKEFKCKKSLRKHALLIHITEVGVKTSDVPTSFKCNICNTEKKSRNLFRRHMLYWHTNAKDEFKCFICEKGFPLKSERNRHEKSHSKITNILERHLKPLIQDTNIADRFKCDICNKQNKSQKLLRKHKVYWHINAKDQYKCDICGKGFPFVGIRNKHKKIHTRSKDFECVQCESKFTTKDYLKSHIGNVHELREKTECSSCGKSYSSKAGLRSHYLQHHQTFKKYKCLVSTCQKQFNQNRMLQQHKKQVHERNYQCHTCDKKFGSKANMENHIKVIHENIIQERKFACIYCDQKFIHKNHMQMHIDTTHEEKEVECKICDKQFSHTQYLNKHFKTHEGEDYTKCLVCQKKLKSGTLKQHMNIHSGDHPYKCQKCGKSFNNSGSYSKHAKVCSK